jgi:tetratricopeptide (TPR) repeat protein
VLEVDRARLSWVWGGIKGQASASSRASLILVIIGSVSALGSIHVPVLLVVAALSTCSAALAAVRSTVFGRRAPVPLFIILALTTVTLLQAVPLPYGLLEWLAPANAEVWSGALSPVGAPKPRFAPLSVDPVATWGEVLKGWTYAAVFIAAMAAGARRGAAWGALVIFGAAATLGAFTLAHGLLESPRVFGVYQPRAGASGFAVGPLINPNNCAGYLNLGILSGAGLLALPTPPVPRWLIALTLAPTVGTSLLCGSRAGVVSLVAGSLLLFVLLRQADRISARALDWKKLALTGGGAAVLGVVFTSLAAHSRLHDLLLARDTTKLRMFRSTWPMIREFAWLGAGRGAFESAFPAFYTAGDNTIFTHPENFLLQWLAEWGLLVTLALVIALVWLLRPSRWQVPRNVAACGLFSGVLALALHNLVDLGSEVPGVVIGGVAAAGFAWGSSVGDQGKSRRPWKNVVPILLVGSGAILVAALFARQTITADRDALRRELGRDLPWQTFRTKLAEAMERHPAEPFFPRLGAVTAWRGKHESPMPWLERALERGLSVGRTHYLLAQFLASQGRKSQALLELRLAANYDPALSSRIAHQAVRLTTQPDQLQRTVPDGPKGARMLLNLAHALPRSHEPLALDLLREAVVRDPKMLEPRLLLVRKLLPVLEGADKQATERATLSAETTRLLDGLPIVTHEARQYRARMLQATGRGAEATRFLAHDCPRLAEPLPCVALWLSMAKVNKDRDSLEMALKALANAGCNTTRQCADAQWAAGDACQAFGDHDRALRHYERSATESNSAASWQKVAKYAQHLGRTEHALRAIARAQMLSPRDNTIGVIRDAERQRLLNELQRSSQ